MKEGSGGELQVKGSVRIGNGPGGEQPILTIVGQDEAFGVLVPVEVDEHGVQGGIAVELARGALQGIPPISATAITSGTGGRVSASARRFPPRI